VKSEDAGELGCYPRGCLKAQLPVLGGGGGTFNVTFGNSLINGDNLIINGFYYG
jgi:hypothetical protein